MINADIDLRLADVQRLSSPDEIAAFFLKLGYDVDRVQQTPDALGITNQDLARHIEHMELIADQDTLLQVYLFEMKSLRVMDRQALARAFRDLNREFLLVITTREYAELDFVLLQRVLPERQGEGIGQRHVTIRPRVLTVDRQKPRQVAMRVLRRFAYTEGDPIAQHEKLLSAYTVAEWAEPVVSKNLVNAPVFPTPRCGGSHE